MHAKVHGAYTRKEMTMDCLVEFNKLYPVHSTPVPFFNARSVEMSDAYHLFHETMIGDERLSPENMQRNLLANANRPWPYDISVIDWYTKRGVDIVEFSVLVFFTYNAYNVVLEGAPQVQADWPEFNLISECPQPFFDPCGLAWPMYSRNGMDIWQNERANFYHFMTASDGIGWRVQPHVVQILHAKGLNVQEVLMVHMLSCIDYMIALECEDGSY